jgi:DNA replication protein DnaC
VTPRRALHPAVDPRCPKCGGRGYVVVRGAELARAERCTCVGRCAACLDSGWRIVADGPRRTRAPCGCQVLRVRLARFDAARIPARHATSTISNFVPYDEVKTAHKRVTEWVKAYKAGQDNRGLVLFGDVGRGKTHLLVGMLRELVFTHGAKVRFVEFSHLLADVRYGFDRGEGPGALIEELVKADVLAIDELGKGRNTEFEGTVLDELVSRRYNGVGTIVATTNYAPGAPTGLAAPDFATGRLPHLVDRVSARVQSRLFETVDFVRVDGRDWRLSSARDATK